MAAAVERDELTTRVCLEGEITIASAAELKELFVEVIEAGKPVEISMDKVQSLDATGAQILWAVSRAAQAAGVPFRLTGDDQATFVSGLRDAGIYPGDWDSAVR